MISFDLPLKISALMKIFSSYSRFECEVGSGKGHFLLSRAERFPDTAFIGIDIAGKWLRKAEEKRQRNLYSNLIFIKIEALYFFHFLKQVVPHIHFSMVHIYCPDPWPKRRHEQRRLFDDPSVFHTLKRLLTNDGVLSLATDHESYYQQILSSALKYRTLFAHFSLARHRLCDYPNMTAYERKYMRQGKRLHHLYLSNTTEEECKHSSLRER